MVNLQEIGITLHTQLSVCVFPGLIEGILTLDQVFIFSPHSVTDSVRMPVPDSCSIWIRAAHRIKSAGATRTEEKYCDIKDCESILVADINVNLKHIRCQCGTF